MKLSKGERGAIRGRLAAVAVVAAALAGCANMPGMTGNNVGGKGLSMDQYTQRWVLNGPNISPGGLMANLMSGVFSGIDTTAWLRGTFDAKGQNPEVQLYIQYYGKGAGMLLPNAASDSNGQALKVSRVQRALSQDVLGRTSSEALELVAVDTTRPYLESRKSSGLDIRLMGHNGQSSTIKIPAESVVAFLAEFDGALARVKK
jgi:hypothetical protein